jgi:hypothetical protein
MRFVLFLVAAYMIASMLASSSDAKDRLDGKRPINLYVLQTNKHHNYDGWIHEEVVKNPSYIIPKFPFYAGVVSINETGYISYIAKSDLAEKDLNIIAFDINQSCSVHLDERSKMVVPSDATRATGHLFRRGIRCDQPDYVNGVISYLEDMDDYKVVRITYGEKLDPKWEPREADMGQ